MTRKEMITQIFMFANFKPSLKKLSSMPLENLRALYVWMFYGETEEFEREV